MADTEHLPDQPSWDCEDCGKPWPCDLARERLNAKTGGGPRLAITMWTYLEYALLEMPTMPAAEVFERFIAWTRPTPWG